MIIGLGIDLVEVGRVERMLESLGERMLIRLFSEREASYIRSKAAPAQHAAVRLAAKEAAFKALAGTEMARRIGWREIEVVNDTHGVPSLQLSGLASERSVELGVDRIFVSLTHERGTAGAVVILEAR